MLAMSTLRLHIPAIPECRNVQSCIHFHMLTTGEADMAKSAHVKDGYHHGELPAELMRLALEHIARSGTEKLSLRALAREAGVSQTAPYRHFPTKRCLLAALATDGFRRLRARVSRAIETEKPIEDRFIDMGVAYVEFALDNPTTYHLMFGSVLDDFSDYGMLEEAALLCFEQVQVCKNELIRERGLDADPDQLGGVIWSGVHGIASLLLSLNSRDEPRRRPNDPHAARMALGADIEGSVRLLFGHLLR